MMKWYIQKQIKQFCILFSFFILIIFPLKAYIGADRHAKSLHCVDGPKSTISFNSGFESFFLLFQFMFAQVHLEIQQDFFFSRTSTPFVDQSAKPTSMTAAPANYCQLSDISNYYLTISFILCVDYDFLISDDRSRIIRKISNFAIVNISKIAMYRVLVSNQTQFYANVKGPQGLSCSNRKDLDNGLAGAWGWRSAYTGYKASVDIKFNCKDAQEVIDLVTKIKCMITENKLHDHVGFHVIGWALHRWYCVQLTTPSTVL